MLDRISVHGARQHNLKNVDVEIPRNSLTVVTGLSGSGKSSLAFDTIYAEGQRRYVETLSPYARQFLDQMERPEVDSIDGLSPAISIEQKTTNRSPRSTVGTITEIYDYLRLLYSSIGIPHCPNCGHEISRQSTEQIVQQVMSLAPQEKVTIYAPIVRGRKGEYKKDLEKLARQGFVTARIDGETHSLDDDIPLDRRKNHTIEVVVDRLVVKPGIERRLEASVDTATKLANGIVLLAISGGEERMYSQKSACPECGLSIPELEPRSFSFNSKFGACEKCNGLGAKWSFDPAKVLVDLSKPLLGGALLRALQNHSVEYLVEDYARAKRIKIATPWNKLTGDERTLMLDGERGRGGLVNALMQQYERAYADDREAMEDHMSMIACKACEGRRLRPSSLAVRVKGMSIADFTGLSVMRALLTLKSWQLQPRELEIAGRIVEEVRARLEFLSEVGLDYLSLDRSAATISGGEGQRIRLATQIGSRLRGVLYVLDEPSIGLHPRDNERLLSTLEMLRDLGNTVLVVEHDQETIERADYVIDLGPGAGRLGGKLVAAGPPDDVARNPLSLTGEYLSGVKKIAIPAKRRVPDGRWVEIKKAAEHNLKEIDVQFPLGLLTVVTGVSGSGKSTLVNDILHRAIFRAINGSGAYPGAHGSVRGLEHVDKVIRIDQDPIGRTPRSNPATYTGVFSLIRDIFALLPESRERGYKPGRFSFNVKGGRCEACEGDGLKRIEMNFLPDVYVTCDVCRGRRYNSETLQVKYRDHSIADVLDATVEQALEVLGGIPQIKVKLQTLMDVGLDYIHLGQSSTTLSGGEAQRIKLAKELSRRQTGKTLYVLDEPTTGLHFDDVRKLLDVLQRLVELGNTVVVIEHNLDVIKTADWILDLGPDGGEYGGRIVAAGPPEAIVRVKESYTGQALAKAGASAARRQVSLRNGTRA